MEFLRVDPANDDEFDAWFAVLQRSELDREKGHGNGWFPSEWRARALNESVPVYHQLFSFGDDILDPVAVAALEVTRDDNLHWIRGELFVDPPERRKGFGSTALARLEDRARALHRPAMLFWVQESRHDQGKGPSRSFAPLHGYNIVEESVRRDLAWPRPLGELERLFDEWSPHASDFEILAWSGATPDEFLSDRAHLIAIMPLEVPDSGFGYEEERWDERRVRVHEQRTHDMGRDLLVSVARRKASGELVGFSELSVSREQPGAAYQWDTLVTSAHRGHRLGGLMKLATMELLDRGGYATTRICTHNSTINGPMIAVNERLGAMVGGGVVTWRKQFF